MEAASTTMGSAVGVNLPMVLAAICAATISFLLVSAWQSTLVHAKNEEGGPAKITRCSFKLNFVKVIDRLLVS